jgi:DNA-binding PadR family transcriptional regulator
MEAAKSSRVDFVELHILHHASERPVYGLWMIEELARHGYRLGPSQLYPRFHRLERNGYLVCREAVTSGKLRKYYRITAAGRAYFRRQKRRLIELAAEALSPEDLRRLLKRQVGGDRKKG